MRDILTGAALDPGYKSVPVASNTTARTPNTTATVTLTCAPGETTATVRRACFYDVIRPQ